MEGDTQFYSLTRKAWVKASDIMPGESLINATSHPVVIDNIIKDGQLILVYALEVEDTHTLFVSSYNLLAHNGVGAVLGASFICPTICKIINDSGCAAGSLIVATMNPGVGIVFGAVCMALDAAPTMACSIACVAACN